MQKTAHIAASTPPESGPLEAPGAGLPEAPRGGPPAAPWTCPPEAPGTCPSDEELAAYIEGTLDKGEARRITEHLASCADCYDIYMGALEFELESSPAAPEGVVDAELMRFPPPARPVPVRGRGRGALATGWRIALPIAAVLLAGAGGTYFQFLATPPGLATDQVVARLPSPSASQGLWLGPTYRGGGDEQEVRLDDASFRTGVQLVNLQTSLRAGKVEQSQDVIARLLGLLKPQPFTGDFYQSYAGITAALSPKGPGLPPQKTPDQALPETSKLAQEMREAFDTTSLDLGQWVEAGRLAALARDPSFFQQSESRSFLRKLLWRDKLGIGEAKLDPPTRESLQRISDVLGKGDLQAPDYAELSRQLEKILQVHYPET